MDSDLLQAHYYMSVSVLVVHSWSLSEMEWPCGKQDEMKHAHKHLVVKQQVR
jgi:hypothetical protein